MYTQYYSTRKTPQSEPIPGKDMVQNNAGGYTFQVDDWARLDRFLILGTEGGTYYVKEGPYTIENAEVVRRCIAEDGPRTVNTIVAVSDAGRAPKNDPALFALAMCASFGDKETRSLAFINLNKVARIGTHLIHFCKFLKDLRGTGRGFRTAISHWYNDKSPESVAYQVAKYQQRDGWSHRDILRLAHVRPVDEIHDQIFKWIVDGTVPSVSEAVFIRAMERAKTMESESNIVALIENYGLTREMIPNKWLNSPEVWGALLEKMPLTAMIRNLGKMTQVGLLKYMSGSVNLVVRRLQDADYIHKSRVHPLSVLVAMKTYEQGHGVKGSLSWTPLAPIVDALDETFYLSFDNVQPTGKRTMLALDVSSSMTWYNVAGMPITPRVASAAIAMVTARVEPDHVVTAFSDGIQSLPISPRQRLGDVLHMIARLRAGGTDCSLPMQWALQTRTPLDTFIIYTDNETWHGNIHPVQALEMYRQTVQSLERYRQGMSIPVKLVVVSMTASGFSIVDVDDPGMLDIVGFDTASPQAITEFSRG